MFARLETRAVLPGHRAGIAGIRAEMPGRALSFFVMENCVLPQPFGDAR